MKRLMISLVLAVSLLSANLPLANAVQPQEDVRSDAAPSTKAAGEADGTDECFLVADLPSDIETVRDATPSERASAIATVGSDAWAQTIQSTTPTSVEIVGSLTYITYDDSSASQQDRYGFVLEHGEIADVTRFVADEHGARLEHNGAIEMVTAAEAEVAVRDLAAPVQEEGSLGEERLQSESFWSCMNRVLAAQGLAGWTTAALAAVCAIACAVTLGTGCLFCLGAALGLPIGTIGSAVNACR